MQPLEALSAGVYAYPSWMGGPVVFGLPMAAAGPVVASPQFSLWLQSPRHVPALSPATLPRSPLVGEPPRENPELRVVQSLLQLSSGPRAVKRGSPLERAPASPTPLQQHQPHLAVPAHSPAGASAAPPLPECSAAPAPAAGSESHSAPPFRESGAAAAERADAPRRRFTCPDQTCRKAFNRRHNLSRHLRIHQGLKRFACTTCGKQFMEPHHLHGHVRIHTGEKPFNCDFCQRAFSRRGNMVRHRLLHRNERDYTAIAEDENASEVESDAEETEEHPSPSGSISPVDGNASDGDHKKPRVPSGAAAPLPPSSLPSRASPSTVPSVASASTGSPPARARSRGPVATAPLRS